VFQTDPVMTPLPQPVGENEWNLVTNSWGWSASTPVNIDPDGNEISNQMQTFGDFYPTFVDGDAITLEGLFKWRGEQLDPVADARTSPGYFSPQCGFSGQLVLLGGNCQVAFGWYNVDDPNSTTPPDPSEIHEFIPSNTFEYLQCMDQNCQSKTDGFCPLAWDNVSPRRLNCAGWQPQVFDAGAIQENPDYRGGQVGFAVIGNPTLSCDQNKYSLYGQNQTNSNGDPWVTTLIYQSTVDPEGFYLAFEDLPMSAADWRETGKPGDNARNDGDFNDFVFYITGLGCEGGGEACDTGLQGACSLGRTDCAAEGQMGMCRPIIQPGAEICDNVDNDCDGFVDNGEGLCPANQVCDAGSCVAPCGGGEFNCPVNKSCNAERVCVDPDCVGVVCEAGQACRGGVCVSACDGVMCPVGQECQLGRCVDPCASIECPAGRVCERGLCLSDCACRGCAEGLTCGADGICQDPACADVMCQAGFSCRLGECVDLCADVVCPGGGTCTAGVCSEPVGGAVVTSTSGTGGTIAVDGGLPDGAANVSTNGAGAASGSNGGLTTRAAGEDTGCGCRLERQRERAPAGWLLLGVMTVAALHRRRVA
jgi:hypothetical protein